MLRNLCYISPPPFADFELHFQIALDEQKLMRGDRFRDSADLLFSDLPYNVSPGQEDTISHYDVLSSQELTDMAALCKQVMRPWAHGDLFCSALYSGQYCSIPPRAA